MGFCRRQFKSKVGVRAWGILPRELWKLFFNLGNWRVEIVQGQGGKCVTFFGKTDTNAFPFI